MHYDIGKILAEINDELLCDEICKRIADRYGGQLEVNQVAEHERIVLSTMTAKGIIENGGFDLLFEADLSGDPQYRAAAAAFEAIGAPDAIAAFRRAFARFAEGAPPADANARRKQYRSGKASEGQEIDALFWNASDDIYQRLAAFVRLHRDDFLKSEAISNHAKAAPAELLAMEPDCAEEDKAESLLERVSQLPHWARIALAARCARAVEPEFRRAWPGALQQRTDAVRRCITAAEESAQRAKRVQNLDELITSVLMAVGAALAGLYGSPAKQDDEPPPADGNLALTASKAARVALKAVEAAEHGPNQSADLLMQAISDSLEVGESIENPAIERRIAEDLAFLERESVAQRWNDGSPVPRTVFSRNSLFRRSWWKFW